jgi:hypothetical protein
MKIHRFVLIVILALIPFSSATALTAVCKNPIGRILGIHGTIFKGKTFDEPDAISNATFTLIWKKGEKEAQIISQSTGGGTPATERALLIFDTNEQSTFLVLYESAVWMYSIYPKPKILILTSHNNGMSIDTGGAVVKSFQAKCEVGD